MDQQDIDQLYEIFHPLAIRRTRQLTENNQRLVHYTNAEAAMNIIRTKEVWMRRVDCMNDYLEVLHGEECITEAFNGDLGEAFRQVFDTQFDGLMNELGDLLDGWLPSFKTDSYIACVSEHLDKEDFLGRLSMWRGYSVGTGVAVVMNTTAFTSSSDALGAYTSPVEYFNKAQFLENFAEVVLTVQQNADFIGSQDREILKGYIFNLLSFALLSTKHPGFDEEREWRVVYFPFLDQKKRLIRSIEKIDGIPQPVYKIPLLNIPEEGLTGMEIPELINRIIIGPSDYALPLKEAFSVLLEDAGVQDPDQRVFISDIPLR